MLNIVSLPKANTHVHANGMATAADVLRLAYKYGIDLSLSFTERQRRYGFSYDHIRSDGTRIWAGGHHSLSHEGYDQTVRLIREPEDLKEIVRNALIKDARDGCIYTRILSSAMNNCRVGADPAAVFEGNMLALIEAIREAHVEAGIHATISVSGKRHLKHGPQQAHRLLDAFEAFRNKYPELAKDYITGFDLAGNEQDRDGKPIDLSLFHDVFVHAMSVGLRCSCHAGEILPSEDVRKALKLPGIEEISHAISADDDPRLIRELRERRILVDQLQIANGQLQPERFSCLGSHPLPVFYANGLFLALGSDDPGLQGTSIIDEYRCAAKKGFKYNRLLEFTANAIRFGFMDENMKVKLLGSVAEYASQNSMLMRPDVFWIPGRGGKTLDLAL